MNSLGGVYIDDVTIGSWLTPFIDGCSLEQSLISGSSSIQIIITGSNFKQTPAVMIGNITANDVQWENESTLIATLSDDLISRIFDVWVINPCGQKAVLPNALQLGDRTWLPLVIK